MFMLAMGCFVFLDHPRSSPSVNYSCCHDIATANQFGAMKVPVQKAMTICDSLAYVSFGHDE